MPYPVSDTEAVMVTTPTDASPSGKEIRLTEYAACAG
jgi:hypothetical protein